VVFGQASLMAGGQAILPPAGVAPSLAQAWLAPIGSAVGQFVDHVSGFELLIALLGFVIGLAGIAESLHQLRAFLAQRAIALAQSDFVSAVSHEMRTPLTTIKMYAEMVEQDVVTSPEKRSAYMRTIAKECDRLGRLVENVLDYARIGRGQRAYQLADTAIAPLVAEAVAALEGPLAQAGLTVEVAVAEGLRAQVDRDAIVQGLINLLGNAAKYAAEGGRVRVTAVHEGQAIVLAVQDFGPGIARTEHKKVFQPFYRIGSELTRTAAGTGLGLALVDAHARGHGGHVELVSTVGQGATFRLVLPQERTSA
jgi:signal transduction histidine kinase